MKAKENKRSEGSKGHAPSCFLFVFTFFLHPALSPAFPCFKKILECNQKFSYNYFEGQRKSKSTLRRKE